MTVPFLQEIDPVEELKQLRDDPLEALKATKRQPTVRGAQPDATRALPSSRQDASGDFEAGAPAVLGPIAAINRYIPGAEAAQAGVRALIRGQSYRNARNDIRDAEDEAPQVLTVPTKVAGGALAGLAIPGGAVVQGARYGALEGLSQSDPDLTVKQRVDDAGKGMVAAGATAGLLENAAKVPWGKVAGALAHPRLALVKGGAGLVRSIAQEASAPVAEAVEAAGPRSLMSEGRPFPLTARPAPPKAPTVADGFVGNGMDNLAEAAKANPPAPSNLTRESPSSLLELIKAQQPELGEESSGVVKAVKQRGRTNRQLNADAERFGLDTPPLPEAHGRPVEFGQAIDGPDLEALLRQSLETIQKGGKLSLHRPP